MRVRNNMEKSNPEKKVCIFIVTLIIGVAIVGVTILSNTTDKRAYYEKKYHQCWVDSIGSASERCLEIYKAELNSL